jgi:hypothetical protein
MRRFFIDMDGVVAKFEPASLEEMTSPGFFLSRKPDMDVINMVSLLMEKQNTEGIQVYILSSYLLDISKEEKIEWNRRHVHIPVENQIYVPYGENKSHALEHIGGIQANDVLVDDFTRNLKEWSGIGVKLYNGINGTHGTWRGFSIHSNMKPEMMVNQLDGISMMETTRLKKEEACVCPKRSGR